LRFTLGKALTWSQDRTPPSPRRVQHLVGKAQTVLAHHGVITSVPDVELREAGIIVKIQNGSMRMVAHCLQTPFANSLFVAAIEIIVYIAKEKKSCAQPPTMLQLKFEISAAGQVAILQSSGGDVGIRSPLAFLPLNLPLPWLWHHTP